MTESAHAIFTHLFRPIRLKGLTLRNRIAVSGHLTVRLNTEVTLDTVLALNPDAMIIAPE